MPQDWKDMLAALSPELPQGPAEEETPATDSAGEGTAKAPQTLHIVLDKKGRKGKVATIIEGFTLLDGEVDEIASTLKRKIGTGGSARGGEILLQGDWRDKAAALLREMGFKVK